MSGFKEVKMKSKKDRNSMLGKVACPNCNSMETTAANRASIYFGCAGLFGFLGVCISIWIPIIGWITTPFFFAMAVIGFIGYLITGIFLKYTLYCSNCTRKFKIRKIEYHKMVKQNKNNNQIIIDQD